ncbi:MAG: DNA replication/repair protein RecF [Clostridiales bacterium]|nr:DNA replication/repair protein RecF [Clostridiales bacterium]
MITRSIELQNFRNYRRLDLKVEPSVNVFYGSNAQGKTNVLESIYLCTSTHSHRTTKDSEMILHGEHNYKVKLKLTSSFHAYDESVSVVYEDGQGDLSSVKRPKKTVFHDDVPFEKTSEYFGIFNAVIFAPEDLMLIKEGPSIRRKYLNVLLSQVKPSYYHELSNYVRFLMNRNRIIKNGRSGNIKILSEKIREEMSIWHEPMARSAAKIMYDRYLFSLRIDKFAKIHHEKISNGAESLFVKYKTCIPIEKLENYNEEEVVSLLIQKWENSIEDDFIHGTTGNGPQRDDLLMSLDGDGLRMFASQGQQRSAALSMKLAELDIVREETNDSPVLLLDDVFGELDASRRKCLLSEIGDAQIFITCTDKSFIEQELADSLKKASKIAFFEVVEGSVRRIENG